MITEQQLVGLLQRTDWTTLSLTATVSRRFNRALRDEQLRSMPPPPWRPPWAQTMMDPDEMPMMLGDQVTGTLLVAPGCRFREELTDQNGDSTTSGCDGERGWLVNPRMSRTAASAAGRRGGSGWRGYGGGSPSPPFRRLLSPSWLLTGFELRIDGPADAAGRGAWRVVATPAAQGQGGLTPQHHDLTVDAELGILLRCESFVRGLPLSVEELGDVLIGPPEAADESRFAVPPDALADMRDVAREAMPPGLATAAGLAADALGFAIRHGPGSSRRPRSDGGEPMPHDADDLGQQNWPPVSDETAYLLYRTRSADRDIAAELSEWLSVEGFTEVLRRGGSVLAPGGTGRLADAITERALSGSTHQVARFISAADGVRYRLDWVVGGAQGRRPTTESCDGQTSWRVYPDRTLTGSVRRAPMRIADLVHPSWLLEWRLADGGEEIVDGRRGYRVGATRVQGVTLRRPLLIVGTAVAVVDAELGVITRLTSYTGGTPMGRWELRDVRVPALTDAGAEFRVQTSPGERVEQEGGPLDDMPEPVRQVIRTAEQIGRVVGPAVSRAADFLESLKSRRQQ